MLSLLSWLSTWLDDQKHRIQNLVLKQFIINFNLRAFLHTAEPHIVRLITVTPFHTIKIIINARLVSRSQ